MHENPEKFGMRNPRVARNYRWSAKNCVRLPHEMERTRQGSSYITVWKKSSACFELFPVVWLANCSVYTGSGGWGDGSVINSTFCSLRTWVGSQHTSWLTTTHITLAPGAQTPPCGQCGHSPTPYKFTKYYLCNPNSLNWWKKELFLKMHKDVFIEHLYETLLKRFLLN